MRTTFVGGGNMASALIGGLLKRGWPVSDLAAVEILSQAREALARRYGVAVHAALPDQLDAYDAIVLAIKPQHMLEVARELRGRLHNQLVVSIAAGIRTRDLSRWLGG